MLNLFTVFLGYARDGCEHIPEGIILPYVLPRYDFLFFLILQNKLLNS